MYEPGFNLLDAYRQEAGLTHGELWLRYFELGGMSTGFEVEAFLYGVISLTPHDHDVVVHAINERFAELGEERTVAYSDDVRGGDHPVR